MRTDDNHEQRRFYKEKAIDYLKIFLLSQDFCGNTDYVRERIKPGYLYCVNQDLNRDLLNNGKLISES
jgi:hypothetical protein